MSLLCRVLMWFLLARPLFGGDCDKPEPDCSCEGSTLLPAPPALQRSLCREQPPVPKVPRSSKASSSIILQRSTSAPSSHPSGPREAFWWGKQTRSRRAQDQSWFGGTACFTLLFPEALGPSADGVQRMCRAAVFKGNRLSAGQSFPSLCGPLATSSLTQQRKRDLDVQERLFLQELCHEPVSSWRQGCHEHTAQQQTVENLGRMLSHKTEILLDPGLFLLC